MSSMKKSTNCNIPCNFTPNKKIPNNLILCLPKNQPLKMNFHPCNSSINFNRTLQNSKMSSPSNLKNSKMSSKTLSFKNSLISKFHSPSKNASDSSTRKDSIKSNSSTSLFPNSHSPMHAGSEPNPSLKRNFLPSCTSLNLECTSKKTKSRTSSTFSSRLARSPQTIFTLCPKS